METIEITVMFLFYPPHPPEQSLKEDIPSTSNYWSLLKMAEAISLDPFCESDSFQVQ